MNPQQQTQLKSLFDNIRKFKLTKILKDKFPDTDFQHHQLGALTTDQLVKLHERVFLQFENAFQEGYLDVLPVSYTIANEFGNGQFNLQSDLQNYINYINNNQLEQLPNLISRLAYYQVANGFWDKSERKVHSSKEIDLTTARVEVDELKEIVSAELKKLTKKKTEADQLQEQVTNFYKSKQQELQAISNSLATVNQQKNQVNDNLNKSTELKTEINSILELQKKNLTQSEESLKKHEQSIEDEKKKFKDTIKLELDSIAKKQSELAEYLKQLNTKDIAYKEALEYAKSQEAYIKTKRDEIEKLTSFAADTTLSFSFDKRSKQLQTTSIIWGVISAVITVLTVGWILLLITDFGTNFHLTPKWDTVILNFLKTSPFFLVLGFALAQYNKERNLQEEYAFKSAVALTINTYADKLNGKEDNEVKHKMIYESVMNVYSKPKPFSEKDSTPTSSAIQTILELLKKPKT